MILFDSESGYYYINCPHCDLLIQIKKSELNCKIFTHAVKKKDMTQVNPHVKRDDLDTTNIFGCGFQFIFDGKNVEKCEGK